MRSVSRLLLLLTVCGLAACSDTSTSADIGDEAMVVTEPMADVETLRVPMAATEAVTMTGEAMDDDGPRSVYTDLDLDTCEALTAESEEDEAEMGTWEARCPGHGGIDLYISEGDLRFDVDAGVPNDVWTSEAGFNTLGERVEWRIIDNEPEAIIIRYNSTMGEGEPTLSRLAVIKIGTADAAGCLIGWVPADAAPSQNQAARDLADQEAVGFDCSAV